MEHKTTSVALLGSLVLIEARFTMGKNFPDFRVLGFAVIYADQSIQIKDPSNTNC